MPLTLGRLACLVVSGRNARIAAVCSALALADDSERRLLSAELVKLVTRGRYLGLVAPDVSWLGEFLVCWPLLSPEARTAVGRLNRQRLVTCVKQMTSALASPAQTHAGLASIGRLKLTELGSLLHTALHSPDQSTASTAESAFTTLVADPSADSAPATRSLLAQAATDFGTHQRPKVLSIILDCFGAPASTRSTAAHQPLHSWLADDGHPAHLAMRSLLRKSPEVSAARCAWFWLAHDSQASAAADRLLAPESQPIDRPWLYASMHLLTNPRRAAALRRAVRRPLSAGRVRGTSAPGPLPETAPLIARRGAPKWAAAVAGSARERDRTLAEFLTDPSPAVRYTAARQASLLSSPPACQRDFCFDADARIARSASLALLATNRFTAINQPDRLALCEALRRSPHSTVRALAEASCQSVQACNRSLTATRSTVSADLKAAVLAATDPVAPPEPSTDQARHLAEAVTALGPLAAAGDAEALDALHRATGAPDPRVRANAVEALVLAGRRAAAHDPAPAHADIEPKRMTETLRPLWSDANHRVRANALRASMVLEAKPAPDTAARDELRRMLRDDRPMHRVAALWLVHRLGDELAREPAVLECVAAAARFAGTDQEKSWAVRAGQRLMLELRSGWAARAARQEVAA